jgi:g-D-glutamyl-meso-diaminopimelate peptidase
MFRWFWIILVISFVFVQKAEAKIVQTDKPYSFEALSEDLSRLKSTYGETIQIQTIGKSHFGREIFAVQLGSGKKNILLIGAHHGREWLTSMLLMNMLETYASAYQHHLPIGNRSSEILNDVSIWFVPMLNPDGVAIAQNQLRLFPSSHQERLWGMNQGRNNFIRWKANGMGVDLNRQYPAGWGEISNKPGKPSFQFYKGEAPLEAVEAAYLVKFVQETQPSMALSYHTAGREIYWHYKNGIHLIRDFILAKKVAKLTEYKLAKPPKKATGGGFTDWFITAWDRPAMTIEISYLVGDRHPPLTVFREEWRRNKYVGIMMAEEAKKLN